MRENAGAASLVAPNPIEAGQRNDPIALTNRGQASRGLVEAGDLPRIWVALLLKGFDPHHVFLAHEAHLRTHVRTEKIWYEVALIGRTHELIEVTAEDFPQGELVHQVLFANLGEPTQQMRYPAWWG
jgi:hypothetical protein